MSEVPTAPGTLGAAGTIGEGGGGPARWVLAGISSPDARLARRRVPVGDGLLVGRQPGDGAVLKIEDPRMSRAHARLVVDGDRGVVIEDLGSRNGTFVDGKRRERELLGAASLVRVGDTLFELRRDDEALDAEMLEDERLVAVSSGFREVLAAVHRVAPSKLPVLLAGETGTGKELVARRIHELSGRTGPMVAVNCAALPAGLVEATLFGHRKGAFTGATTDTLGFFGEARGGSLFLDELGELPLEQQAKLLRVLENEEMTPVGSSRVTKTDVRVLAATNVDLEQAIARGRLRNDLFARLAGAVITLPPLRERRQDLPALARSLLAELAPGRKLVLGVSALERLLLHSWPRNVRELKAVLQRVVLHTSNDGDIAVPHIERELGSRASSSDSDVMSTVGAGNVKERPAEEELVAVLRRFGGNVSKVAEHYGKDAKQIYRWLRRYGLAAESFRE